MLNLLVNHHWFTTIKSVHFSNIPALEGLRINQPQGPGGRFWNIAGLSAVATLRDARLRGAYETLQRRPRCILGTILAHTGLRVRCCFSANQSLLQANVFHS